MTSKSYFLEGIYPRRCWPLASKRQLSCVLLPKAVLAPRLHSTLSILPGGSKQVCLTVEILEVVNDKRMTKDLGNRRFKAARQSEFSTMVPSTTVNHITSISI